MSTFGARGTTCVHADDDGPNMLKVFQSSQVYLYIYINKLDLKCSRREKKNLNVINVYNNKLREIISKHLVHNPQEH